MTPLAALVALSVALLAAGEDCVWDMNNDYPALPPLFLDDAFKLVLPVMKGEIREVRIPSGSKVTLACPGSKNTLAILGEVAVEATCAGGKSLTINGEGFPLSTLGCSRKIRSAIQKRLGICGGREEAQLHKIGFQFQDKFFEQLFVCFDHEYETTLYTRHVIHGANIAAKDTDTSSPYFKASTGFFSVSTSKVYPKKTQFELLTTLLGDEALVNTVFDAGNYYFAKGHLSPNADFVTTTTQDATYYLINAVPQWQIFNNGNWKTLEEATRDLAEQMDDDLWVYSGTWGVLEMDDVNSNPVQIFLGLSQDKSVIPAPAVIWKVVHDEISNCAMAFVGVNNPHLTSTPAPICEDRCSTLDWVNFSNDLTRGYTYCCSVSDLRAAIPHVPDIGSTCPLLSSQPPSVSEM